LGRCASSVLWLLASAWVVVSEEVEEWADVLFCLGGVPHCCVSVDQVVVAASDSLSLEDACLDEVGGDALSGAFGDADLFSDVSEPGVAVFGDAKQHLGVVGQERPAFARLLS
jgi:hypothetical protein